MTMHRVGIVCAADDELAPFLPMTRDCAASDKAMLRFYEGTIQGAQVVAVFSGVCKVNAAIATQLLIDTYGCDAIVNAGTAGGMDANLRVFDLVVATDCAYWDVAEDILTEFHPWMETVYFRSDERLLALARAEAACRSGQRIAFGTMVTGEAFIKEQGRGEINEHFHPLSVDMETASIAHVCHVNQIPFIAARAITDTADHSGTDVFDENCGQASRVSADFVAGLLGRLAVEERG